MAWCFITRASVATELSTYPCVSSNLWVNIDLSAPLNHSVFYGSITKHMLTAWHYSWDTSYFSFNMMVADDLVPAWRQAIGNHHVDLSMSVGDWCTVGSHIMGFHGLMSLNITWIKFIAWMFEEKLNEKTQIWRKNKDAMTYYCWWYNTYEV